MINHTLREDSRLSGYMPPGGFPIQAPPPGGFYSNCKDRITLRCNWNADAFPFLA